jgi:collagen type VII alpha
MPIGATGFQGATGALGPIGATGFRGGTGLQGATGFRGASGPSGQSGLIGNSGLIGMTGPQGSTGLNGPQGSTGPTGFVGASGLSSDVIATFNDNEIIYNDGGLASASPNFTYDPTANGGLGEVYIAGKLTVSGIIDPIGLTLVGQAGVNPVTGAQSSQSLWFNSNDSHLYLDTTPLIGTVGATGAQGATGLQGATGTRGATGLRGVTGFQGASGLANTVKGATGATGLQGNTGAQGSTGVSGLRGATGLFGNTGPVGQTGLSGNTGLMGNTGLNGMTGLTGNTGFRGATGMSGLTGATGSSGATGYAGATGISQNFNVIAIHRDEANSAIGTVNSVVINGTSGTSSVLRLTSDHIRAHLDTLGCTTDRVYTFGQPQQPARLIGFQVSSTDTLGAIWDDRGTAYTEPLQDGTLNCLAWNGRVWVMGGYSGNQRYSLNGTEWLVPVNAINAMSVIIWDGTKFIGLVNGSFVYTSINGSNWVSQARNTSQHAFGLASSGSGGRIVAVGFGGIMYTDDPTLATWTNLGTGVINYGTDVIFNGTLWLACGSGANSLAYSYDGATWTGLGTSLFSNIGNTIAWSGSIWVAGGIGTNSLAWSYDGINWTGLGVGSYTNVLTVTWLGHLGCFSAVGLSAGVYYHLRSYDGKVWIRDSASLYGVNILGAVSNQSAYAHSLHFKKNVIIALGNGGAVIATSQDSGQTWTSSSTSVFTTTGNAVDFSGHLWVAVGSGTNTLADSLDAVDWTGHGTGVFSTSGNAVKYSTSDRRWVALGQGTNSIAWSIDGLTWLGQGTSIFSTAGLSVVSASNSRWVAGGSGTNAVAYTINVPGGWTGLGTSVLTTGRGIACNQANRWVIVGTGGSHTLAYMDWDGTTSPSPTLTGLGTAVFATQCNAVAYANGIWVSAGLGANTLAWSNDGITWLGQGTSIFSTSGDAVSWSGTTFVAGGSGTNTLAYSPNGQTWIGLGTGTFSTITQGLAWNSHHTRPEINIHHPIISCGSGTSNTLAYSDDGQHWTQLGQTVFSSNGNCVHWNGQIWVAGGSGGNSFATSQDGLTWTGQGTTISGHSFTPLCLDWNGTRWLAGGSGFKQFAYSDDGLTWSYPSFYATVASTIYGLAWNGALWVGAGHGPILSAPFWTEMLYSSDGITWTAPPYPGGYPFGGLSGTNGASGTVSGKGVAYGNNRFVAVGYGDCSIAWSSDGLSWTRLGLAIFSTSGNGIAWNGRLFVAVGSGTNSIAYSSDGVTWTGLGTGIFSTSGNSVCWTGERWVATGTGTNTLAYSDNGTTWTGLGTTVFSTSGLGCGGNPTAGNMTYVPSQLILNTGEDFCLTSATQSNEFQSMTSVFEIIED